ncbi:MAG: T9SS type A sorting domain-containing protein [Bacteroidetes bacterium]|nr:T9SS type A sorting domain-containing protein [Bacteroidota bacterium]
MNHKLRSISVLFCLFFGVSFAHSQQAVVASGGVASGSGSVAYSIGQIANTSNTSAAGTVSEGVQQAYEIYTVGLVKSTMPVVLNIFPNPTTHILHLAIDQPENISYTLMDLTGKSLIKNQVNSPITLINMEPFARSSYLLVVSKEDKTIQTFQIIKN